jgi:adenylate cyclase, class 2
MEIEIKSTIDNKISIRKKILDLGAKFVKKEKQTDIYYKHHNQKRNEYIRLRIKKNKAVFGYHLYSKNATQEKEIKIDDWKKFKEVIDKVGLSEIGTIEKIRETFKYKQFKICIDDIKNFGLFVEIETTGSAKQVKNKREACLSVLDKLDIPRGNISNLWLCNLVGDSKIK